MGNNTALAHKHQQGEITKYREVSLIVLSRVAKNDSKAMGAQIEEPKTKNPSIAMELFLLEKSMKT